MTEQRPPIKVRTYRRTDGTKVSAHNRKRWQTAKVAWAGAGVSGVTTLALLADLGLTTISVLAIVLTALLTTLAVKVQEKSNPKAAKMRAAARTTTRRTTKRR